jgi:hypothetical protein
LPFLLRSWVANTRWSATTMRPLPDDWQFASIQQLRAKLAIAPPKVLSWINSGELVACNIATRASTRPVYRIRRADFDKFMSERSTAPPAPSPAPSPAPRRRAKSACKSFV